MTISTEERDIIDYQLELLKAKLSEEFGEFAKGISIEWEEDPEFNALRIGATFMISAQGMMPPRLLSSTPDHLKLIVMHLVHTIEKALYNLLPIYNTEPQTGGVKIRIDSHLPKGVIWMHPEVYRRIQANPELRERIRRLRP